MSVAVIPAFDIDSTLISQYANSPVITALVDDFGEWFDPTANLTSFYNLVWNIFTAQGFGLDIWGRILGVTRYLTLPAPPSGYFGFYDGAIDGQPFNQAPFNPGSGATSNFALTDSAYLTLLMVKALANICRTTIPLLNQLLQLLFPGEGNVYVQDLGNMQMEYVFTWTLSPVQYAIVYGSGVLPHPTGVSVSISSP